MQSANSSCLAPIHIVIIDTKIGSSLSLGLRLPSSEILTKLGTESEMSSLKRKTWKPHLVVPLLLVKSGSSRTRISQQKLFWQLKDLSDDGVTIPLKIHFLREQCQLAQPAFLLHYECNSTLLLLSCCWSIGACFQLDVMMIPSFCVCHGEKYQRKVKIN